MPDEIEVPLEHAQEHIEKAHEEAHEGGGAATEAEKAAKKEHEGWTRFIAVVTALLAVIAAIGALQSGLLVNEALLAKNEALLQKSEQVKNLTEKSDDYNYYQAEGLKSLIYETAAQALPAGSPTAQGDLTQSKRYKGKQADLKAQADAADAKSQAAEEEGKRANADSERIMKKHHVFAFSVSLCQIAIALSAVAALTRNRRVWAFGLVAGLAGTAALIAGFLGWHLPFAF